MSPSIRYSCVTMPTRTLSLFVYNAHLRVRPCTSTTGPAGDRVLDLMLPHARQALKEDAKPGGEAYLGRGQGESDDHRDPRVPDTLEGPVEARRQQGDDHVDTHERGHDGRHHQERVPHTQERHDPPHERERRRDGQHPHHDVERLSLIHISEPTRLGMISY